MTQEVLARKAGIDPKTIRSIEAGRRTPRVSTLRQLADVLGLDDDERESFYTMAGPASTHDPATRAPEADLPAQLPSDLAGFTGRRRELDLLNRLLLGSERKPPTVLIATVSGTAGVGKTTLAVHWAHQVRHRFPDGQLYVNLRGYDPLGRVMTPVEAIRGFLDALGVSAGRTLGDLSAKVGLYRSLLSDKRILVVLDNARDTDQVRPLLPGSASAVVIVTSRNGLTGLVATAGAEPVTVDLMSTMEARELLARRLGNDRVAAELAAADAIIHSCARLPLALTIAAARARQTGFPLASVAAMLADGDRRLDALDAGDPNAQVRSVFSWSYDALRPASARLFRLLGQHPGPDTGAPAAASLIGQPLPETRRLLAELARAHLLEEPVPGRYSFHDLLRAYAADLTRGKEPEALDRLLDHYLHTACAADRILNPKRDPIAVPLAAPAPLTSPEEVTGEQASAWLTTEYPVVLSAVRSAADANLHRHTWQLAWSIDTILDRHGQWAGQAGAWRIAARAAGELGELTARGYAYRRLANAELRLGNLEQADAAICAALDDHVRAGDPTGQAHSHHMFGTLRRTQGRIEDALDHARQALALFQRAGHHRGEALAVNTVGWYLAALGHHGEATSHCRRALALLEEIGDVYGQAHTWDNLGSAHLRGGQLAEAAECYEHALALFRRADDRFYEARMLDRLGDTHLAAGNRGSARAAWEDAERIFVDIERSLADAVRIKLDRCLPAE